MPYFNRTLTQVLKIHNALYDGDSQVTEKGKTYPIETVREPKKNYRQVTIGPFVFITQNTKKASPATAEMADAAAQGTKLRITWVLQEDGGYLGRVITSEKPGFDPIYQVNNFRLGHQNAGKIANIKSQGRREG